MAAKRKRNFKAEYARRIAKGAASGKTRQQARGHREKEHVERARRSKSKYGASPGTMTKLRAQAKGTLLKMYQRRARQPVNEQTVKRGMKYLHADDLRKIINDEIATINAINGMQALSPTGTNEDPNGDSYFEQLAEHFPTSVDLLDGEDINPLWYHR